nr:hypothetical protein [Tanacetum cinerariifolium]
MDDIVKIGSRNMRIDPTLKFISKGELTQVYGLPIPDTTVNDEIVQSEAYQTYLALSTGTIPHKKGRGIGGKRKRTIVTSTKKSSITADDNFLPDPYEALKLGKSISKTKAEIDKEERRVHETHERLVTEQTEIVGKKLTKFNDNLEYQVRELVFTPDVLGESKGKSTSSKEGAGITLEDDDEKVFEEKDVKEGEIEWVSTNNEEKADDEEVHDDEAHIEETDDVEEIDDDEEEDNDDEEATR